MRCQDWRKDVDWRLPVPAIAARYGISTQRVYQVLKNLGLRPNRVSTARSRIHALDTANLTIDQIATAAKCSPGHAKSILRECGKAYMRTVPADYGDSLWEFYDWLIKNRKYPAKVARDICCRVRKVETTLGITLLSHFCKEAHLSTILIKVNTRLMPLARKPNGPPYHLAPYRHAIKRYWEYLSAASKNKGETQRSR